MSRPVLGQKYVLLGAELRRVRKVAGKSTSQIPGYSASHVSLAERGMAHISQDFVKAYINLGGDRAHLLALYEQAKGNGDEYRRHLSLDDSLPMLDDNSPPDELAACYEVERAEDTYHLAASGAVQIITNIVQVRAVNRPARFYPIYFSYNNDERPGVLTVESGVGCKTSRIDENSKGHITCVFELDKTLTPESSDPYSFSYSVHVQSDVPCSPIFRNYSNKAMALHAIRIQFTEPALPSRVWWFRGPHHTDAEAELNRDRFMELAGDNFYFRDFYNVRHEYWGIAWDWEIPARSV